MDGSMQSKITATILGLAAQIEREFISSRTKEALAKRKKDRINLVSLKVKHSCSSLIITEMRLSI